MLQTSTKRSGSLNMHVCQCVCLPCSDGEHSKCFGDGVYHRCHCPCRGTAIRRICNTFTTIEFMTFNLDLKDIDFAQLAEQLEKLPHVCLNDDQRSGILIADSDGGAVLKFRRKGSSGVQVTVVRNPENHDEKHIRHRLMSDIQTLLLQA